MKNLLDITVNKYNIANIIAIAFSSFLAMYSFFPPMQSISMIFVIASMLGWLISAYIIDSKFFKAVPMYRFLIFVFVIYTAIVPYIFGNPIIAHRYLSLSQMFLFYLIYEFNVKNNGNKNNLFVIIITLPFIAFTILKTGYGLLKNPYLARSIKNVGESSESLLRQGIGGYSFIYFLLFVSILTFYLIISTGKKINTVKILSVILCISSSLVIVISNYFTCLVILVASIVCIVLFKLMRTRNIFIYFTICILLIIFLSFSTNIILLILEFAINKLISGKTLNRLMTLFQNLQLGNLATSLLSDRYVVFKISWDSFLANPIMGIIITKIQKNGEYLVGFGQHSQILDTFALYGTGIGILQIYIYIKLLLVEAKRMPIYRDAYFSVIIAMIILFFVNNATPSIGFVIFMVIPTVLFQQYKIFDKEAARVRN